MRHINSRYIALQALAAAALVCAGAASDARAVVVHYDLVLTGPAESPTNNSPGLGFGTVDYDNLAHTMHLHLDFAGLMGTTTASHIHAATTIPFTSTAGVATTTPSFAGFPLGVSAGTFDNTLDLTLASSYNPSFVTANGGSIPASELALTSAMATGRAYWNVHSNVFPGGEIRAFIPAPSAAALLGIGVLVIGRRRR